MRLLRITPVVVIFLSCPAVAPAALIIDFEPNVEIVRPSNGTTEFTVGVRATSSGSDTLNNYSLPFNVGQAGLGVPQGISFGVPAASGGADASKLFASFSPAAGADAAATDNSANISFDDGDVKTLFDITLVANPRVEPDKVFLAFDEGNPGFNVDSASGMNTINSSSFQVTAIPEPSSLFLTATALSGVAIAHRLRRRRTRLKPSMESC